MSPGPRPPDSESATRDRIACATLAVVREHGVEGLTHRRVAAEAGVSLGSTTYHYATLEDLLEAALKLAVADGVRELNARFSVEGADLSDVLVKMVTDRLGPVRHLTGVRYELYLAALRRPGLRALSRQWSNAFEGLLAKHTDARTAHALVVAVDGLLIRGLVHDVVPDAKTVRWLINRIINTGPSEGLHQEPGAPMQAISREPKRGAGVRRR